MQRAQHPVLHRNRQLVLARGRSRYEYRWWGNDLFWFSYSGLILPLRTELNADPALPLRGKKIGPLQVNNAKGERRTKLYRQTGKFESTHSVESGQPGCRERTRGGEQRERER